MSDHPSNPDQPPLPAGPPDIVVSKATLMDTLRKWIPTIVDIRPTEDGNFYVEYLVTPEEEDQNR